MSKKIRSEVKNPGLQRQYNSRIRQEHIDYDYVNSLSEAEKEFLNKFTEEHYGAALDFQNLENNLHNTPELKKKCTDRNNAQNRCMYGRARAMGKVHDNVVVITDENGSETNEIKRPEKASDANLEDYLVDYIDSKKNLE